MYSNNTPLKLLKMEQQKFRTITQTSEDTITCDDKVFYSRQGYMKMKNLSRNSLSSPYQHVKSGKAEMFNFMGLSFFRPL